ncbi:MAG: nitrile hydratase accessory protein [Tetrasphaera sp.]
MTPTPPTPTPPRQPDHGLDEPWQAQLFAMTVALQDGGVIAADEWALALGARIAASEAPDGSDYWDCWAAALTDLLAAKGLVGQADLSATTAAWHDAAAHTPHGQPIVLPGR